MLSLATVVAATPLCTLWFFCPASATSGLQPPPLQVGPRPRAFPTLFVPDLESSGCESGGGCQFTSIEHEAAAGKKQAVHAVVEFYAPWCPQCQAYAPTMERLGHTFNTEGSSVLVARVDCAARRPLCRAWGVKDLPTILAGEVSDFAHSDGRHPLVDLNQLQLESPHELTAWISHKWNLANVVPTESVVFDSALAALIRGRKAPINETQARQADTRDVDLAFVTAVRAMIIDLEGIRRRADQAEETWAISEPPQAYSTVWQAAYGFAKLLAQLPERHSACRDTVPPLLKHLESIRRPVVGPGVKGSAPQLGRASADAFQRAWRPCGQPIQVFDTDWHSCAGTFGFQRGWPCGLWLLLHSLTVGLAEVDASAGVASSAIVEEAKRVNARDGMVAIRGFVQHFFECTHCRRHFLAMSADVEEQVSTGRDAMLWLWRAHNNVTSRLLQERESDTDNPVRICFPNSTVRLVSRLYACGSQFKFDAASSSVEWPPAGGLCPIHETQQQACSGNHTSENMAVAALIVFYGGHTGWAHRLYSAEYMNLAVDAMEAVKATTGQCDDRFPNCADMISYCYDGKHVPLFREVDCCRTCSSQAAKQLAPASLHNQLAQQAIRREARSTHRQRKQDF
jgi:thiol-disulfide isomerase/thioredoxin